MSRRRPARAERLDVRVHRVSQGSGVFMLTDAELDEVAALGCSAWVEVSLFARPNAGWDTSATSAAPAGAGVAAAVRGQEQLVAVLEDASRAAAHGIRSVLLADVGAWRRSLPCAGPASCPRKCRPSWR